MAAINPILPRRVSVLAFTLFVLVAIFAGILFHRFAFSDVPFDSAVWKASSKHSTERARMSRALERLMVDGIVRDRATAIQNLGLPDDVKSAEEGNQNRVWQYRHSRIIYGFLSNPMILSILFDDDGRVSQMRAHGD